MDAFWGIVGVTVGGTLQIVIEIFRAKTRKTDTIMQLKHVEKLRELQYQRKNALKLQSKLQLWSSIQARSHVNRTLNAGIVKSDEANEVALRAAQTGIYICISRVTDNQFRQTLDSKISQVITLNMEMMRTDSHEFLEQRNDTFQRLAEMLNSIMESIGEYVRLNLKAMENV